MNLKDAARIQRQIEELLAKVAALDSRVRELETKRGPGRPRKDTLTLGSVPDGAH